MAASKVKHLLVEGYVADGAITKHRIVKAGSNTEDVAQVSTASETPEGVSLDTVADDESVNIVTFGNALVEAGGSVSRGNLVEADGDGKAIALTPAATTADTNLVGMALTAGGSGDLITVRLASGAPFMVE